MQKKSKVLIAIIAVLAMLAVVTAIIVLNVSGTGRNTYNSHMELAQRYLDELNYEQAIAQYEAAIEIDPKREEAYLGLAEVYIELEDYQKAVNTLERGIEQTNAEELRDFLAEIQEEYNKYQISTEDISEKNFNDLIDDESNSIRDEQIVEGDNSGQDGQMAEENSAATLTAGKYVIEVPEGYSVRLRAETDVVVSIYTMEKSSGDTLYLNYKETYFTGEELSYCGGNSYITYLTVYSGTLQPERQKIYYDETDMSGYWDSYDDLDELEWYSETDIEGVFGIEITEGQTVTIDNQNYNGRIDYCSIKYFVKGSDTLSGYEVKTDYWWRTYMGSDDTVTTAELTEGTVYYSFLYSCNKLEYTVTSGSIVWFTEYTNKDLLTIY